MPEAVGATQIATEHTDPGGLVKKHLALYLQSGSAGKKDMEQCQYGMGNQGTSTIPHHQLCPEALTDLVWEFTGIFLQLYFPMKEPT